MMGNIVCACSIVFVCFFGVRDPTWTLMFFQKGGYNTVSPHAAICLLFMKNKHDKRTY